MTIIKINDNMVISNFDERWILMIKKAPVYLTEEGYNKAKKELDELINIKRPEIINNIKETAL